MHPLRRAPILATLGFAAVIALGQATPARADKAQDRPTGWQTWTWAGNCYAIDYAKGPAIPGVQNGDTYIAVKHLPREHNYDNVSVVSGFGDITGVRATLTVDDQEFELLVYGDSGFVKSGEPERRLIDLLDKATEATVTWFRQDGLAVQSYDVRGFGLAKKTIDTGCPHAPDATAPVPVASAQDPKPPAPPKTLAKAEPATETARSASRKPTSHPRGRGKRRK